MAWLVHEPVLKQRALGIIKNHIFSNTTFELEWILRSKIPSPPSLQPSQSKETLLKLLPSHWFCSVLPFCSILSRNYYSKPLLSLNLPKKGASSQNHSPSPFQQAFMKPKDLQSASDRAPDWTLMDPKHSSAAFLLLISFKQVNTTNNITPSQQCFPGANQAIKKA